MSKGYNDLNDLIQNQRALAELVHEINGKYILLQTDMEYAKELDGRLKNLNDEMTKVLDDFDERISASDTAMKEALEELQTNAAELKESTKKWVDALQVDSDGDPTQISKLVEDIVYLTNLVFKGTEKSPGVWTGGLRDLESRIETLESKSPSLVIMEENEEIPIEERVKGVLYGRKTSQVTDIESGQAIKISPYLQGVIVD